MPDVDPEQRKKATAIFKLAIKASGAAFHRTINRPPKGKGWVQCVNAPPGLMCRPAKAREAIELFIKAYTEFPDIVALNQIALSYEMLGEFEPARSWYGKMLEQAIA